MWRLRTSETDVHFLARLPTKGSLVPAPKPPTHIRSATEADLHAVLRLNAQWQHVTSPLDADALAHLHAHSAYHRVVEVKGEVVAFLLAFGPGAPYDSPNYRWFGARSSEFLYIDRVVVSAAHQRGGFGHSLYRDVEEFARAAGLRRLVCEVDIEPLNAPSDAFHSRRGFAEVGTQWLPGGTKRVSLRELSLRTA